MIAAARDCLTSEKEDLGLSTCYQIMHMVSDQSQIDIPEAKTAELKKLLLDFVAKDESQDEDNTHMRLMILVGAGTQEQAIEAINRQIEMHRKSPADDPNGMAAQLQQRIAYSSQYGNHNPWNNGESPFVLPQLEQLTLPSLPSAALSVIRPENQYGYGGSSLNPSDLIPHLATFESPTLRAWIALRADDKDAIKKALSVEPPAIEEADFNQLRAIQALGGKDYAKAYALFEASRPIYASDRNLNTWLNFSLIAIASEMSPEQRAEISEKLRPILIQARQVLGTTGAPVIAAKADQLGFDELAKRMRPQLASNPAAGGSRIGPAAITPSRGSSSSSAGSMDKLKKFTSTKKYEAAAREALLLIRKANASTYRNSYEIRQIEEALNDEIRAELIRMVNPGDSKSLTKRLEYADICAQFGKMEAALETLSSLNKERPEDPAVAARLAFLLPPDQEDLALSLLTKAASTDEFVGIASAQADQLSNGEDATRSLGFYNTVARWLEETEPETLSDMNLTWIAYYGKSFFERGPSRNIRGLTNKPNKDAEKDKDYDTYVTTGKRLALAMMRHPSLSEQGFRLYSASEAWETPPAESDEMLRATLLALHIDPSNRNNHRNIYTLVRNNGGSSSGDDLPAHSSARMLTERLSKGASPDEILPPAYLKELNEKNPKVGAFISAIATLDSTEKLSTLWDSGLLEKGEDPISVMLREAALNRASSIPGATSYFLKLVREIDSEKLILDLNRGQGNTQLSLLSSALRSASSDKDTKSLNEVAEAVSTAIFGKEIDWDAGKDEAMKFYRAINAMEKIIESVQTDETASIRILPALHRLGVPVGDSEYSVLNGYSNKRLGTPEEAEKFFESIGFLEDIASWQPLVAIIAETDQVNGELTFRRKEMLLNESLYQRMNTGFSRTDLVKRLTNRKPVTFGNLITAATAAYGNDRKKLAAEAFAHASPELAKLPVEQVAGLSLLIPWLPADAVAKLPASFREKASEADKLRLVELNKTADEFLKSTPSPNQHERAFDQMEDTIGQLLALDFDKAVEVFLECERRFTASLAVGARLSSYTSNSLEITERDEAIQDLMRSDESALNRDPALAVRFHAAIAASPEGSRFCFTRPHESTPLLSLIGEKIHEANPPSKGEDRAGWRPAYEWAAKQPENIRRDAMLAVFCYQSEKNQLSRIIRVSTNRKKLAEIKDIDPEIARLHSISIGIADWEKHDQNDRDLTAKAFATLITDETLPVGTRMELATLVSAAPEILANPEIATAVADTYAAYAGEERSIVNPIGIEAVSWISATSPTPATLPQLKRINATFWENANSPKAGGHPPIPPSLSKPLFLAASTIGDKETANKLLNLVRPEIEGSVPIISSLILAGNHELAVKLLNSPGRIYRKQNREIVPYTAAFEKQLAAFRKQPDLDPLALLRIEAQLTEAPIAGKDEKPTEDRTTRELRLAAAYKENPPADRLLRTEILSTLTRDSIPAAIALRAELAASSKEIDLDAALADWHNRTGEANAPAPRLEVAPAEAAIVRQSAFADWFAGDPTALRNLAEACGNQPPGESILDSYYNRFLVSAPLWTAEAIHRDSTASFKDSFEIFEKFALVADSRKDLDWWQLHNALSMCEFLANWEGDPKKFTDLTKRIKRLKKQVDHFKTPGGISHLATIGKKDLKWNDPSFAEARRSLLMATLTRPEMKGYYSAGSIRWIMEAGDKGDLREDLLALTAPLPEGLLPPTVPALHSYRAEKSFADKNFADAEKAYRAAANAMDTPPWKNLRTRAIGGLAQSLLEQKKHQEATTEFNTINKDDVPEWYKKRYDQLGKKIAELPKK